METKKSPGLVQLMGTKHLTKQIGRIQNKVQMKQRLKNLEPNRSKFFQQSHQSSKQTGRELILTSLSYLHDSSQRDRNISLLMSVSARMFIMPNLWGNPHAAHRPLKNKEESL